MGNDEIEHLDFPTPDPEDKPDPGELAELDQEQAEYQANKAEFARIYGFVHDCHCAQDWAEGKTTNVPECFVQLCNEAMAFSAFANAENRQLRGYLRDLLAMNQDLANMLKEHGHEDELQKYLTETIDVEEVDSPEDLESEVEVEEPEEEAADDDDGDDLVIA